MNAPARPQEPFAQRFPAYLTADTAAQLLQASRDRRAEVLERRALRARSEEIRSEVVSALRAINRGAKIVKLPGCAA